MAYKKQTMMPPPAIPQHLIDYFKSIVDAENTMLDALTLQLNPPFYMKRRDMATNKTDYFKGQDWSAPKRYPPPKPPKLRVPLRLPKEYLIVEDNGFLPPGLLKEFRHLGGEVCEIYGATVWFRQIVLIDDFIPEENLDLASDLFTGHDVGKVNADSIREQEVYKGILRGRTINYL